jgi:hypothetical protein
MNAKRFLPFYRNYVAAMSRVSALEMAFSLMLDSPRFVPGETAGFNAQRHRKKVFVDLLGAFNFAEIVETGTFVGDTTGYLATTAPARVFTCETSPTFLSLARSRLNGLPHIRFTLGDSRQFLRSLFADELAPARLSNPVFFYLDAHWEDDLPLADEIGIIAQNLKEYVIMVDDFQVPGDPGYGWDDYGGKKALNLATFKPCFDQWKLLPFFPNLPAPQETGLRRGCVVLAPRGRIGEKLAGLASLRVCQS